MTFQNSLRKKRKKMVKKCNVLSETGLIGPWTRQREREEKSKRVRGGLAKIQTKIKFRRYHTQIRTLGHWPSCLLSRSCYACSLHLTTFLFDSSRERDGATMLMTFQASAGHVSKSSLKNVSLFPFYSISSFQLNINVMETNRFKLHVFFIHPDLISENNQHLIHQGNVDVFKICRCLMVFATH